jgi:transcriptional antiterminator
MDLYVKFGLCIVACIFLGTAADEENEKSLKKKNKEALLKALEKGKNSLFEEIDRYTYYCFGDETLKKDAESDFWLNLQKEARKTSEKKLYDYGRDCSVKTSVADDNALHEKLLKNMYSIDHRELPISEVITFS